MQKSSMFRGVLIFTLIVSMLSFMGCNGDSGGGGASKSTLGGDALKGPIEGGTVHLFSFDQNGTEQEIVAENAPVTTDANGAYSFEVKTSDIKDAADPLLVRVVNGTMNGEPAPVLEALVLDSSQLEQNKGSLNASLSAASTVAAKLFTLSLAADPATANATQAVQTVENELDVDLDDDPADAMTGLASVNDDIDQCFDLINTPNNNTPLLGQFFDYLAANMSTGAFDGMMADPANATSQIAVDLSLYGLEMSDFLAAGTTDFWFLSVDSNKDIIGNDGVDAAIVNVSLMDAQGDPIADGTPVDVNVTNGQASDSNPTTTNGLAQFAVTSSAPAGQQVGVEVSYQLATTNAAGNLLQRSLNLDLNDCQAVAGLTVGSDVNSIIGNSADQATITADLQAVCNGSMVADGTVVDFVVSSGTGTLSAASATTVNGQAQVTLTSGTPGQTVTVQASQGNFSQSVDVAVIADPCDPGAVNVAASPASIVMGETSAITATVQAAGNCTTGVVTYVQFSLSGAAVDSGTTIAPAQPQTDQNGQAAATLTAGQTAGTITVTAAVTDSQGNTFTGSTSIDVTAPPPDPCDPAAVNVTASPMSIGAGGTSTITATVQAAGNCATGVVTDVQFSLSGAAVDSGTTIAPAQPQTQNGVATATLTAGQTTGTITVTAEVTDSQGNFNDTVDVTVQSCSQTSTVEVTLPGVPAGTTIGSIDLTIDYDENEVSFNNVVAGTLNQGSTVIPADNTPVTGSVKIGLINATGFDGGGNGTVLQLTFDNTACVAGTGDFSVTDFTASDLSGVALSYDASDVDLSLTNN